MKDFLCEVGQHNRHAVGRCAHCNRSFCAAHEGRLDLVAKGVHGQFIACSRAACIQAVNRKNREHWASWQRAQGERRRR